ncbi:ATP-binding protein [Streptomyces sp. 142MFCol3.1]|uniref:ATP-binding protein n=1 Tax=Streptomyces sp. 142MFCol3.1 TaxID=1172179 RepID=UPI00048D37DC|nr:ATP-binding protein [Streptomyces sp. 142MFCol3.1]
MTPPLTHGERPTFRAVAPAPLITAVAAALAVACAVALAPDSARAPLAWGTGTAAVLLCAAVAVAAHAVRSAKLARRRLGTVTEDAGRLLQERARLTEEFNQERARLADDAARERTRLAEAAARERIRLTEEFASEREQLAEQFAVERQQLADEQARLTAEQARLTDENAQLVQRARQASGDRAAAISATANAAGRMQALATGMLADLRGMEERHSDEDVLADLLHLDHRTAQAGRLADSVAVLTGARSGRRWARPIVMESILRGAMGRISGYQRVRVHSASEAAVAGHAAEGVMHALAELLDNAANFSPPTAEVHVYVEEVPAGVIVSVEDSGLVMGDVQLRRAERAVSGDVAELGGLTGTRLGLAVVGRLARKHGLTVSFRPSARGGTGVLVLIPQDLLIQPSAPLPAEPAPAPRPAVTARSEVSYAAARAVVDLDPDPVPTHDSPRHEAASPSTGGLPKRRRGRTLAHAERSRSHATPPAAEPKPRTPDEAKARAVARFGSFRDAVRGAAAGAAEAARREGPSADVPPDGPENAARDETVAPTASPTTHSTPHSHPEGDTTP